MKITPRFYSEWFITIHCHYCDAELTQAQKMYSHGTCPKCGGESGCSIMLTKNKLQRNVYRNHWYFFGLIPVKKFVKVEYK
jgi:hypothetical protein